MSLRRRRSSVLVGALVPVLAIASCTSTPPEVDVTAVPRDVQSPFADMGSATDLAAVRASLVDALSTEEDQLSRSRHGAPLQSVAARSARLHAVESSALAARDLAAMAFLTTADTPFRSSRFVVSGWQGVAVRGDRAKAYVQGHDTSVHWDGSTAHDPTFQYKALLRRDATAPHGWILLTYRAASREQG